MLTNQAEEVARGLRVSDSLAGTAVSALTTGGEVVALSPTSASQALKNIVQALIASDMIPHVLRGHAMIVIGQLCLHDKALAKRLVAALALEVTTAPNPVIRNNAVIALTDLCIRFVPFVLSCQRIFETVCLF